jgi:hypothetical protein
LRVKKECQGVVLWCWMELKGVYCVVHYRCGWAGPLFFTVSKQLRLFAGSVFDIEHSGTEHFGLACIKGEGDEH